MHLQRRPWAITLFLSGCAAPPAEPPAQPEAPPRGGPPPVLAEAVPDTPKLRPGHRCAPLDPLELPERACIDEAKMKLRHPFIPFQFSRWTILPPGLETIQELAGILEAHPEIARVEVGVHTDSKGTERYSRSLSKRRAQATVDALVAAGVDRERLEGKAYGKDVPLDTNATEEGRAHNRRVEFVIVELR